MPVNQKRRKTDLSFKGSNSTAWDGEALHMEKSEPYTGLNPASYPGARWAFCKFQIEREFLVSKRLGRRLDTGWIFIHKIASAQSLSYWVIRKK